MPSPCRFVGVVHLLPLPAAPRGSPGFAAVHARALADAEALAQGGVEGMVLENFGDAPFARGSVGPHVVAGMAVIAGEIRARFPAIPLGINVLRNDAAAALGIAAICGAAWVRINVLAGATVTDQGVIEGDAHGWLRYRRELGAEKVQILADVHVKHGQPLGGGSIANAAADLAFRAGADTVIVTGAATGAPASFADVAAVRAAIGSTPLWVGSGVSLPTASEWRTRVDGAIVGTLLHENGQISAPVSRERVQRMAEALRG